jgi:hypothetical protein
MPALEAQVIHEQFEVARLEAVALTDEYHALEADDPRRDTTWLRAMSETERARELLERWLRASNELPERTAELTLV